MLRDPFRPPQLTLRATRDSRSPCASYTRVYKPLPLRSCSVRLATAYPVEALDARTPGFGSRLKPVGDSAAVGGAPAGEGAGLFASLVERLSLPEDIRVWRTGNTPAPVRVERLQVGSGLLKESLAD